MGERIGKAVEALAEQHPFFSSALYSEYKKFLAEQIAGYKKIWNDEKSLSPEEADVVERVVQAMCLISESFNVSLDTPNRLLRTHDPNFSKLTPHMFILPGICKQPDIFTARLPYEHRRGARLAALMNGKAPVIPGIGSDPIDAPFVFRLVLKTPEDTQYREIATVAASIDAKKHVLYVDQIQGPWRNAEDSPLEKLARTCFSISTAPPFAAMTLLAANAGFSTLAIRDASANWHAPIEKRHSDLHNPYTRTINDLCHYMLGGATLFDGTYHVTKLPVRD